MTEMLWWCTTFKTWLMTKQCPSNRKHARGKDRDLVMKYAVCIKCEGVRAMHERGESPEPRYVRPFNELVSPVNGMAEARREPSKGQKSVATNLRRGRTKPSQWPAQMRGVTP